MDEGESLRIKLCFASKFRELIDSLCLTDRQKEIAELKYLRGWVNADIAAEIDVDRKTITKEMKVIRKIMASVDPDKLDC